MVLLLALRLDGLNDTSTRTNKIPISVKNKNAIDSGDPTTKRPTGSLAPDPARRCRGRFSATRYVFESYDERGTKRFSESNKTPLHRTFAGFLHGDLVWNEADVFRTCETTETRLERTSFVERCRPRRRAALAVAVATGSRVDNPELWAADNAATIGMETKTGRYT